MKTDSSAKRAGRVALALVVSALGAVLAFRLGGTNAAAGVATALGIGFWLWSARRSYQAQAAGEGPRLIVDRLGEWADEERPRSSFRRIRVANSGGRPIHQIEVTLVKCGPAPAWFEPVRLQRMQGGAHPFDLPPRSEVFVDFVALPQGHPEFILVHDSSKHGGLPNGIAIQELELTVQVTANGLPTVSVVFAVSRSTTGVLSVVAKAAG